MNVASPGRPVPTDQGWPPAEQPAPAANGLPSAFYFDSGGQRLFGWLHSPASGVVSGLGLVICKPFGYEAICAHRSLRAFAEAAEQLGVPTLRVDYLGTGDSAEIENDADQLEVWTHDVIAAVEELRRLSGVEHVCLLGVRLGALIAVRAANACAAVDGLVLISPIISGRRYLRELRTTRMAAALGSPETPETRPEDGSSPGTASGAEVADGGAMEVSGFSFSAATLATLAKIDLKAPGGRPIADILIIDGRSMPVAKAWAQQLAERGSRTKYLALPGLIEMIMTAPQSASVPHEMIEALRDWLLGLAARNSHYAMAGQARSTPLPIPPGARVMTLGAEGPKLSLTERPVFFGADAALFGIVTEPRRTEIRRRAVIMLNAGADVHVGVNRINVTLARQWAANGYVVLRMDLGGLGDSGTRQGQADNEVFPPAALEDIAAALEYIRSRYGVTDLALFGLCSGAYHALRAAAAKLPVKRILMVNPLNYFWKKGQRLDALQVAEVVLNPVIYSRRIFSWAAWKRFLTGRVNIWRIAKISAYRPLLEIESRLRDLARRLRWRLPEDLGWELEEIDSRNVKMIFVFSRGEPGIDLLRLEAGSSVKRLEGRCRIHVIDGADHVFSQGGPRSKLTAILSDELFARH